MSDQGIPCFRDGKRRNFFFFLATVSIVTLILGLFHCKDTQTTQQPPQKLPTEIEIKKILSQDSLRMELESLSKKKGYKDLKDWKEKMKLQSGSVQNNEGSVKDLQNRLAWWAVFQESGLDWEKALSQIPSGAEGFQSTNRNELSTLALPTRGNPNQKKVLIIYEFSDFTCPFCKKSQSVSAQIRKDWSGKIVWKFVDYPLDDSPFEDSPLHYLGACVFLKSPDQYWKFFDKAFSSSGLNSFSEAGGLAQKEYGFSSQDWEDCRHSKGKFDSVRKVLSQKKEVSLQLGVEATPNFLIGNTWVRGYLPWEKFQKIVEREFNTLD